MFGGLLKSSSRSALFAATGFLAGALALSTPYNSKALAADLGGDCCADLEERVAELEATTARKGNRKVSLTIYGHVNRALLWWDDGIDSDIYSVDNDHASTRFGFKGKGVALPGVEVGYLIEAEWRSANSSRVTNIGPDADDGGAQGAFMRHAMVYLNSPLGKVSLGHTSQPNTGITEVDLSATKVVATARGGRVNNSFFLASNGTYIAGTWGNVLGNRGGHFGGTRRDLIRYDTPKIAGFVASAAWGEDDFWGGAVRWAGTFGDFKIAAGAGFRSHEGQGTVRDGAGVLPGGDSEDNGPGGRGIKVGAGSFAVLHDPTGLNLHVAAGRLDPELHGAYVASFWYVKAGLAQNFFGIGKTAFYGEYYDNKDTQAGQVFATVNVRKNDTNFYGLGVVQHLPQAATELYLGYRHYSAEINNKRNGVLDDFDTIMGGMRVRF